MDQTELEKQLTALLGADDGDDEEEETPRATIDLELEAKILDDLDNDSLFEQYAERLRAAGDPRWDVACAETDGEKQRIVERSAVALFGLSLACAATNDDEVSYSWRHGFIDALFIGNHQSHGNAWIYERLATLPMGRFIRSLTFFDHDLATFIDVMIARVSPDTLQSLTMSCPDTFWDSHIDLSRLYARTPRLASLAISCGGIELGEMHLPVLHTLDLELRLDRANVQSIMRASWPALKSLRLAFGTELSRSGEDDMDEHMELPDLDANDFAPLLAHGRFPALKSLELVGLPCEREVHAAFRKRIR